VKPHCSRHGREMRYVRENRAYSQCNALCSYSIAGRVGERSSGLEKIGGMREYLTKEVNEMKGENNDHTT